MANVVQGTSNGEYDLARSLGLYDTCGKLPELSREIWAIIGGEAIELAREFWRRYAKSPEVVDRFDDAKIEQLSERILPYINCKFDRLGDADWTRQGFHRLKWSPSVGELQRSSAGRPSRAAWASSSSSATRARMKSEIAMPASNRRGCSS